MPLMGSHHPGISGSPLSSNIVNRPASSDFFKNYMSPMSPTNKIYAGASNQNFVNQNLHQVCCSFIKLFVSYCSFVKLFKSASNLSRF